MYIGFCKFKQYNSTVLLSESINILTVYALHRVHQTVILTAIGNYIIIRDTYSNFIIYSIIRFI